MFELKARDGLARICEFETRHGKVETPALMPVINPNQLTVEPRALAEKFNAQIMITNAYIIWNDQRLKQKALEKGLHEFLGFEGAVMTDSGTFQSHVYGDLKIEPDTILDFQKEIGTDIGTMLDVFIEPDESLENAEKKVEQTLERAKHAAPRKGELMLAGVVQGGVYQDLRERCASELSKLDFDVYPIGGVVPLMENYRYSDLVDVIIASKKGLRLDKPVHLFGCGHPMMFGLAVLLGCDLFDSSSYAKYAKDRRMMFTWGTRKVEDLKHLGCECPVCSKSTLEDLNEEKMALHNLYVSFGEIKRIKQAIHEGSLWDLVEQRARHHPSLLAALRRLSEYGDYLERFEPLSRKGALFYTGAETLLRPAIFRYRKKLLTRYERPAKVLVELKEPNKPYSRYCTDVLRKLKNFDAHLVINSTFGPVPIELDEMYPVAQSLAPEHRDLESIEYASAFFERFYSNMGYEMKLRWPSEEAREILKKFPAQKTFDLDIQRVKAVADMQFGKDAGSVLLKGDVKLTKSKTTGKIRNVHLGDNHILSMRAHDGLFTLKLEGAKILHKSFPKPKMRVTVSEETAEFNREGKNVFAKFVLDCDDELRPGDEVLIVDEKDEMVAVGRARMNREEMLAFESGVAVGVR